MEGLRSDSACTSEKAQGTGGRVAVGRAAEQLEGVMTTSFDLIVVGTGMAGNKAAHCCRQAGWRVAVVDDDLMAAPAHCAGVIPRRCWSAGPSWWTGSGA